MIGIFSWFTTPVSTLLGLVAPALLRTFGFTSDWDVLFDSIVFSRVMYSYVILGCVGLVLCTIPFIWYDLTREMHDKCVAEIEERERANKGETDESSGGESAEISEAVAEEVTAQ